VDALENIELCMEGEELEGRCYGVGVCLTFWKGRAVTLVLGSLVGEVGREVRSHKNRPNPSGFVEPVSGQRTSLACLGDKFCVMVLRSMNMKTTRGRPNDKTLKAEGRR